MAKEKVAILGGTGEQGLGLRRGEAQGGGGQQGSEGEAFARKSSFHGSIGFQGGNYIRGGAGARRGKKPGLRRLRDGGRIGAPS